MNFEALRNLIHREVLRVLDRRTRPMPCVVDAYDPSTFTVKVKLQPSGTLTGWVQLKQAATGDGFGDQAAPNIGDPGWLTFHENDPRAPVFEGTVSNALFPAVPIQAGERLIKMKWGQSLYFKNDGSVTVLDGTGASLAMKAGQITATDKAGSTAVMDGAGNITLTATVALTVKAPAANIGNGGTLQPVKLADGSNSTILKAQ